MAELPAGSGGIRGPAQVPELPPSMRDRVPFLLFRASQISLAAANQMLAPMGLNARHVGILTMVTELAPMTQKALGEALGIDRTTVVTLLDELASMGYIARPDSGPAAAPFSGTADCGRTRPARLAAQADSGGWRFLTGCAADGASPRSRPLEQE